ncbi:MAG: valine--tRNA ligase, partial [Candidatus Margulisiibacteriota bacterium]
MASPGNPLTEALSKTYDPKDVEQKWYQIWEENGYFKPEINPDGPPFAIVIPPPNVTGSLHMGHALDETVQDIIIRYHRMRGDKALWLPGTDHAGIATQNVVEKELKKTGLSKEKLGREKFVERIWQWKEEYGGQILRQLRRLGASCDWSRERFTMDAGLSKAVTREFVTLYKEGLVYRGKRLVNWCPRCKTAISDIEVDFETKKGQLWYLKYPLEKSQISREAGHGIDYIIVATTRPETMLGDTAVAVNPDDERYRHLIGKMLVLPLVGRKIPIIKDELVDPTFGTGAVKVTPAHDPNDFEMGEKHNLPRINILSETGAIVLDEFTPEEAANLKKYAGLDRFKARKAIVEDLEAAGLIEKIEDYENSVGSCYRCHTVIEPYLSDQWYVAVKKLAEPAIRAVEEGKIQFIPDRWTKVYINWMTNLKDWCISRQLWWGHKIPVWYCKCSEIIVSETPPTTCPKCGGTSLVQDPDVFDTWFSSCLWPFSTLGWPDAMEGGVGGRGRPRSGSDLATYYPTSVLVTGYDIITFWVSRMIMMGLHFMQDVPFKKVFVHGLVRDAQGKKMSKSTGNVVDPLILIGDVGADALRLALSALISGQGQDIKLADEKIKECRNFCNKIWNASRYVMMNLPEGAQVEGSPSPAQNAKLQATDLKPRNLADKWILSRYHRTVKAVTELLDNYDFGEAARRLYEFVWGDYCDWYLELSKSALTGNDAKTKQTTQAILAQVLLGTLKLLHPFMPFITEEIYQKFNAGEGVCGPERATSPNAVSRHNIIVLAAWPAAEEKLIDEQAEKHMEIL